MIKFERNAMMSVAHLIDDDGGSAVVWCAIPGGRPVFQFSLDSTQYTTVANAPQCDTHKQFQTFVRERFADDV